MDGAIYSEVMDGSAIDEAEGGGIVCGRVIVEGERVAVAVEVATEDMLPIGAHHGGDGDVVGQAEVDAAVVVAFSHTLC